MMMFFVPLSSHQDKHQPFPMGLIRLNHRPPVH
nr:MAG TPA: TOXN protein [Caudoviricetes sp.]